MLIMFVDLLEVFIASTGRETVLMADDSCYSVMLCFTDYIILRCRISSFLWHVGSHYMGGEGGWPLLCNFKGRVGKTVS